MQVSKFMAYGVRQLELLESLVDKDRRPPTSTTVDGGGGVSVTQTGPSTGVGVDDGAGADGSVEADGRVGTDFPWQVQASRPAFIPFPKRR